MNKTYVYFNSETGVISQVKTLPEGLASINRASGEDFLEVPEGITIDPDSQKVDPEGKLIPYVKPVDEAVLWKKLRVERARRLSLCDWTMMPDAPTDKQKWGAYRQALRDLPNETEDIHNIQWPSRPE